MESKIKSLKVLEALLIIGTIIIGIITVIDVFIPDPIFLLDEAALTAITGLLTYLSALVSKKIDKLEKGDTSKSNMKEIGEITNKVSETATIVKKSRNK